jgi:putative zinc finger/helix-turn-helix YgiT family protein
VPTKRFPWKCAHCHERQVYPDTVPYRASIEHDGRAYDVYIPALEVPKCHNCGRLVMTEAANENVTEALRHAVGLLTPAEIRRGRERLRMTQKDLATLLSIADATLSRWETGAQIQQRSLDGLLRLVFEVPEARARLMQLRGLIPTAPADVRTIQFSHDLAGNTNIRVTGIAQPMVVTPRYGGDVRNLGTDPVEVGK